MQQFDIILKNPKIKSYRLIALLIVFLNLAIFLFLLFSGSYFYDAAACVFLVGVYCLYRFYFSKKNKTAFFFDEFSFFILAGCWVALQVYLLAFGCLLLGILYHFSLQKLQFIIDKNSVKKINLPKADYSWDMFSNVLIRDNILTLDFNNNKLIQVEIENNKDVNEAAFNQFAKEQIIRYSGNPVIQN